MKLVVQRVTSAQVTVDDNCIGKINHGLMVLLGVGAEDTKETVKKYVDKLLKLRIFQDENDKTNLSIQDVNGELLIISQFTLYADCRKGNRPNFMNAGKPDMANELYEEFIMRCKETIPVVEHGEFGADMKVSLTNDGPFTVVIENLA
ncbi:MAG: D-aminoacyl-tRNA deacylase [bacterium]|nr:D-aminoacyl-tRNA deacylase [bacterium]